MKQYTLVYQAGIANVFSHDISAKQTNSDSKSRERVMQYDFRTCENFCRGLKHAGRKVSVAWCNQAGDISTSIWNFEKFHNAPFCESFRLAPKED